MKNLLIFFFLGVLLVILGQTCECKRDPYEQGVHWDYSIQCENGFAYKIKDRTAIQLFNSDGTPLRCGQKIY